MEKEFILAECLGQLLLSEQLKLVTAESCTGGWIAKIITDVAGCSAWFERGYITYNHTAKQEMLGVPNALIARFGEVSSECVQAMAEGALRVSRADVAVAVSGIAGPTGGSEAKPVGTVWFGFSARQRESNTLHVHLLGQREAVRRTAVRTALQGLLDYVQPG